MKSEWKKGKTNHSVNYFQHKCDRAKKKKKDENSAERECNSIL